MVFPNHHVPVIVIIEVLRLPMEALPEVEGLSGWAEGAAVGLGTEPPFATTAAPPEISVLILEEPGRERSRCWPRADSA